MTSPVERANELFEAREAKKRLRQEAEWDLLSRDLDAYIAVVKAQFNSFHVNVVDWSVSDFAVLHAAEFEGGSRTVHKPATAHYLLWNPITRYLWLLEWKLGAQGLDGEG